MTEIHFVIRGAAMLGFNGNLNEIHPSEHRLVPQMRSSTERKMAIEEDHKQYGIPLKPMEAWKWMLKQGPEVFDHFQRPWVCGFQRQNLCFQ